MNPILPGLLIHSLCDNAIRKRMILSYQYMSSLHCYGQLYDYILVLNLAFKEVLPDVNMTRGEVQKDLVYSRVRHLSQRKLLINQWPADGWPFLSSGLVQMKGALHPRHTDA
jgi:hypothetical protein